MALQLYTPLPSGPHKGCHAQVAAGLTDAALPKGNCAVRIMLFVGGPTTEGGGQVVDKELSEPIRSHKVCHPPPPATVRDDVPYRSGRSCLEMDGAIELWS